MSKIPFRDINIGVNVTEQIQRDYSLHSYNNAKVEVKDSKKVFKILVFLILIVVMFILYKQIRTSPQEKELLIKQVEIINTENSVLNKTAAILQYNYENLPSGYSSNTSLAAKNLYNFFSDVKMQYNNTNLYTLIPSKNTEEYIDSMISFGENGREAMRQLIDYCNTKSIVHFNIFSTKITDSIDNLKIARQELNLIMEMLNADKPIGVNIILNK